MGYQFRRATATPHRAGDGTRPKSLPQQPHGNRWLTAAEGRLVLAVSTLVALSEHVKASADQAPAPARGLRQRSSAPANGQGPARDHAGHAGPPTGQAPEVLGEDQALSAMARTPWAPSRLRTPWRLPRQPRRRPHRTVRTPILQDVVPLRCWTPLRRDSGGLRVPQRCPRHGPCGAGPCPSRQVSQGSHPRCAAQTSRCRVSEACRRLPSAYPGRLLKASCAPTLSQAAQR
mmetsp:Transcript_78323/g.207918  ORF Transcript_78323/g.207918 Transcript_78323/m.207918 type:complete len:232 (+) Transcript_78323:126-821(+)